MSPSIYMESYIDRGYYKSHTLSQQREAIDFDA